MPKYSKKEYSFVKFQKSSRPEKKYMAILQNKKTKRQVKVHFGAKKYSQYRDATGLGLYSHKNHNDPERRKRYIARHQKWVDNNYWSPALFSMKYLW